MNKKQLFVIILAVILVFGLAACNRSRSTPPPTEDLGTPEFQIPGTEQAIEQLSQYATQTAMAMSGETEEPGDTEVPAATDAAVQNTPVPTTAAPAPTATQQPAGQVQDSYPVPNNYTLQRGEFPYCLARRFNLNPTTLLNANGLSNASQVYPGTVLTIPSNPGTFPGQRSLKNHPVNHTVVSGETIYSISCTYGDVDPRAIIDANNLNEPYTLSAGDVIRIP